ncbi:MAG: RsmB/NOP family class I SAM-dependent RNA methyltransferase [Deltaproteobacteria bacterium]|nr:RsmB/NOP family class I SAM-dependent RNA methyltransferase [Deltaproteobacteria bacterium]
MPDGAPGAQPAPSDAAEGLERYAPLVDDVDAFLAACERPLPRVAWANPLRGDPEVTARRILARCPEATPVPWWPHAYRLPDGVMPGNWLEFMLGLIHVQEEATLWPAALVGAAPGDRVLDLCAAPGNKTALIAAQMGDRGLLVANEKNRGRLSQLRFNLERLGVTCAAVSNVDGRRLPAGAPRDFDHALVDAPCSCEGTTRKLRRRAAPADGQGGEDTAPAEVREARTPTRPTRPRRSAETTPGFRKAIQAIQIGLLRKAIARVRPGGTVIYATCTYAPEENERVLHAIDPAVAAIEPLTAPPGAPLAPGVRSWGGVEFRSDVVHAARFWPHHHDTGGFFVARLRVL